MHSMDEDMSHITRSEVQDIVDRSTKELHDDLKRMREEREKYMQQIARDEVNSARSEIMKFFGWGAIATLGAGLYFFGGLTGDVETLQRDVSEMTTTLKEFNDFMNRGDRFTVQDAQALQNYSDQQDRLLGDQDERLQTQIDRNHEEMRTWRDEIISEIRQIK